jgi:hypothetical protein
MEKTDDTRSLFGIIGFEYRDCPVVLDPAKLVKAEEPEELKSPEDVIKKFLKQGYLCISDATLFTIYFGMPKDPKKKIEWDSMDQGNKAALARNLIAESGVSEFAKLA